MGRSAGAGVTDRALCRILWLSRGDPSAPSAALRAARHATSPPWSLESGTEDPLSVLYSHPGVGIAFAGNATGFVSDTTVAHSFAEGVQANRGRVRIFDNTFFNNELGGGRGRGNGND